MQNRSASLQLSSDESGWIDSKPSQSYPQKIIINI